jgi:hypothetical protein
MPNDGAKPDDHAAPTMTSPVAADARVTHEASVEGEPKKGHKSLIIIIAVAILLLILGGVAYAASSCSISIPGLSSLFGCTTESLATDQGVLP